MGEITVRSHASGKKQAVVTLSQTALVSHFFGAKCETTPGLSSTGKPEEPSTSSSHDAGHIHKESEMAGATPILTLKIWHRHTVSLHLYIYV